MLRRFKVSNFRGFSEELILDLSETNAYAFNTDCIKNGIINNAIIYGKNGIGKSNLALAVFDIIEHLTDKYRDEKRYNNYLNAFSNSNVAEFEYEFLIEGNIIIYRYKKRDYKTIEFESLIINDNLLINFDRTNGNNQFDVKLKGAETLKNIITDNQLSVVKYIRNNSVLDDNLESRTFSGFFNFVENMLFFRSLEDRTFCGYHNDGGKILLDEIIEKDNVKDFENFLNTAGVECKLKVIIENNKKNLSFDFNNKTIPFYDIASTGTSSLTLFYFWFQNICDSEINFLFIDEFDAFYHHELSQLIVKKLKATGIQFILTTHNTTNLSNDLLRPDCYFNMSKSKILPLSKCTNKELREAHNIEKMYKSHTFNVE